jgi:hypothetical protein
MRPIGNHTQAHFLLGNQPRNLALPERFRRLIIRLHLMPVQDLDDPVVGE